MALAGVSFTHSRSWSCPVECRAVVAAICSTFRRSVLIFRRKCCHGLDSPFTGRVDHPVARSRLPASCGVRLRFRLLSGRWRQFHRHHRRPRDRCERPGAPGRHDLRLQPRPHHASNRCQQRRRTVPVPGAASGPLHIDLRTGRLRHAPARGRSADPRVHRHDRRGARPRVAAGERDGAGRLAGDRSVEHPRPAELQAPGIAGDSQRARHVGTARHHAFRADEPCRRRRQPRRARKPGMPPTATAGRTACWSRTST